MISFRHAAPGFILTIASLTASADTASAETKIDPVNMEDFANGSELSTADAVIRRIELQPPVITGIQRRDLRDIRVYDANNAPMPSVLSRKDGKIKTSRRQLAISAQYNRGTISTYVIDRGKNIKPAIDALRFKWRWGKSPKIFTFKIEHSDNKKSWESLVGKASVINLDFRGARIEQNEIDINKVTKRYLRLVPVESKPFPPLAEITATLASKPHSDYWWWPAGKLEVDATRPDHYRFRLTTGVRPVQFKLSLPLNSVITGALYKYSGSDTNTRKLVTRNFETYALSINRQVINARPFDISRSSASHWEIAAGNTININSENLPGIMVAYPQYRLYFAADGDGPYTLVWGNRDAGTQQQGDLVERIRAGKLRVSEIPEVNTGVFLDNDDLVALVESRNRLWVYAAGALIILVAGIAAFVGFRRYRGA